ncbi:uncharacterized protein LOC130818415 [Amaranthus tricolor]|uniref:uncharacterized protein LOC130818415 n=1 Tax=Amaranthus tricolor TaxID=29722 RepID=UPI00258977E6|nr:uncharacterized protein LOC130818415 [Amaranthus tricolor]
MGQISGAVSKLEARDSEKLPSQTEPNPRMNASAMTLRSGTELQEALKERKKHEADKDIYKVFKKCEVNIPLLDALKQIPRYAKVLQELCTEKRKQRLKGIQKVKMSEHISAIFQRKLPPKCGDPTDRSNAYPNKVGDLIFPADFYVLDMEHDKHSAPILLGRPFMKTAKTKIDVDTGSLTMEFDSSKVEFDIYDSMKFPPKDHSCFAIDLVDTSSQDMFDIDCQDKLKVAIEHDLNENNKEYVLSAELQEVLQDLKKQEQLPLLPSYLEPLPLTIPNENLLPSVLQAPKVELKPLPEHLKYVFLEENETCH